MLALAGHLCCEWKTYIVKHHLKTIKGWKVVFMGFLLVKNVLADAGKKPTPEHHTPTAIGGRALFNFRAPSTLREKETTRSAERAA
jgi:hypothetical protein